MDPLPGNVKTPTLTKQRVGHPKPLNHDRTTAFQRVSRWRGFDGKSGPDQPSLPLFLTLITPHNDMNTSYNKAFDEALSELGELLRRRRGIDGEISRLRNVILALYEKAGATKTQKETLMNFFGEIDVCEPTLTEAVKDALYNTPRKLPAIQLKEL